MPAPGPLRPIARRALAAQSDERLVRLVREGHEPAFEEMVRRYRGPLVAFAAAIVSADRAEDVVQASLIKANDALRRDEREIALRPWLFAIVRNGALNEVRGEAQVDELHEAAAIAGGTSELAEQREDLDRLVVAMCALPEAQRQALVKRELEGVGHGEIAAQLGTTATAVRGLIFRARVGLRDALGALLPLPVLRTLLAEGAAAGAAGGGAAAGLLGGTAAKGGTAVAAAVVALGTGVAIERGQRDESRDGREPARVSSAVRDGAPPVARAATAAESAASTGSAQNAQGNAPSSAGDGPSGEGPAPASGGSSGSSGTRSPSSGEGSGGAGDETSGGDDRDDGSDDDRSPVAPPPPPPEDDDDDDNSGPGGGGSSGSGSVASVPPPPDDDFDDDSSGPGGNSGPGGGGEVPELPDDDDSSGSGGNSGPGGGDDDD